MASLSNYKDHFIMDIQLGPIYNIKNPKTYMEVALNGTPLEWRFHEVDIQNYEIYTEENKGVKDVKLNKNYEYHEIEKFIDSEFKDSNKPIKIKKPIISKKVLEKKKRLKVFNDTKKLITKKIVQRRTGKNIFMNNHQYSETCNCDNCKSYRDEFDDINYEYFHKNYYDDDYDDYWYSGYDPDERIKWREM
jgi:hypothetical protein